MKKFIVLVAMITLFVPSMFVEAASIESPETQGQGKVAVTAEGSYLFDRDLKFQSATGLTNEEVKNVEIDKAYQMVGKISYGVFDAMDIYVKLGVADSEINAETFVGGAQMSKETLKTNTNFLYGGGVKLAYEIQGGWIIGGDLQYLTSKHKVNFTSTDTAGVVSSTKYKSCRMQEWHVAPYVAKKISNFTPYVGAKYSDWRMKIKSPHDSSWWNNVKYKADDNIGMFVGTDCKILNNWKLNLEGRFIDETAMSFGATYQF